MASVQMNRGTTEEIEATQLTDGLISFDTDKNYMYMDYEKNGTLVRETFGGLKNTDADLVSFDGSKSAIEATNVQDAIDEIIESGKQASAKEIITDNGTYFKESISSGGEFKLISPNGNYVKMNVSDLNYAKIESGDSTESTGNITWSKDKSLNLDTVIVTSADPIVSRDIKDQTVAKATNADKADALTVVSKGSATKPVYFNANGVPVACTYSLEKSVPSNAVFTDTTYGVATQSANGLMSGSDKTKLDGVETGANKTTVTNNLTTTSTTNALSAKMGKQLQDNKADKNSPTFTGAVLIDNGALRIKGTDIQFQDSSGTALGKILNAENQKMEINCSLESDYGLFYGVRANTWQFAPYKNGNIPLGSPSYRWGQIYSTSATINTSDRNTKKDIVSLDDDKTKEFVMNLNPVSYKFKDGTSGRTHTGLIAQDVEETLYDIGLTEKDFAGLCKDKKFIDDKETDEYLYGLRYEEFISPLIKMVQMQQKEIEELKERIEKLEK